MKNAMWATLIRALPEELSVSTVSKIFKRSVITTRRKLIEHGYRFKHREPREYVMPTWAQKADWKMPNIDIARKFGITKERVRVFRKQLGKPKVESRGRKKLHVRRNGT